MDPREHSPATLAAHGGGAVDGPTGGVVPGVFPAVTFARDEQHRLPDERIYLRYQSQNAELVESLLAKLEGGASATLFSSGLAASTAVFLTLLRPGDVVVATRVMYFGVRNWLRKHCEMFGMKLVLVDGTDGAAVAETVTRERPRLVWIETPGNPLLDVVDIESAARAAHAVGALLAVDSTAATPILTQPLALGADIVMHSATKYLNGHHDVLAGALVFARAASTSELATAVGVHRKETGAVVGPFEAWLLLRGMRTLALRVRQQSENALAIARWLSERIGRGAGGGGGGGGAGDVLEVLYPGLPSHRNHDVAVRQMRGGYGGLLSFRVGGAGDPAQRAIDFACRLKLIMRATSLGGVETFVEHRRSVEGPDSTTPPDLLRLAVGIEDAADLVADLAQAFAGAK